jgi:hypothetical protein
MSQSKINETSERIASLEASHSSHELVCAERYAGIISRITRMELFLVSTMVVLLTGMGSVIWNVIIDK